MSFFFNPKNPDPLKVTNYFEALCRRVQSLILKVINFFLQAPKSPQRVPQKSCPPKIATFMEAFDDPIWRAWFSIANR